MSDFDLGLQRIVEGQGLPIALAGLTIVFTALLLITLFITLLPRILAMVARRFPETVHHAPRRVETPREDPAAVAAAVWAYTRTRA
ncbi:MAG: OadG family transporter subunit [Gemmatimonadaceae bacterium]|nr:OadG family transporter subunit [Gemmatimonadaceae bacterium]